MKHLDLRVCPLERGFFLLRPLFGVSFIGGSTVVKLSFSFTFIPMSCQGYRVLIIVRWVELATIKTVIMSTTRYIASTKRVHYCTKHTYLIELCFSLLLHCPDFVHSHAVPVVQPAEYLTMKVSKESRVYLKSE